MGRAHSQKDAAPKLWGDEEMPKRTTYLSEGHMNNQNYISNIKQVAQHKCKCNALIILKFKSVSV